MQRYPYKIAVDLSVYESRLRGQIGSDLNALQIVFGAISEPDYDKRKYILKQGLTIAEIAVPPVDFLQQREINKCFKSIIGSLQDYMDNLLAVLRLKNEKIALIPKATTDEKTKLLQEKFSQHLLDVSTDRKLNIPEKLNLLLSRPEHQVYKVSLQSYFDVRNGLEHHKGIAKAERVIKYYRMGLASTAGYEIIKPGPLGENEGVVLKTFDEEIVYDKGGTLLITKPQLDGIVLSLLLFTIPTMQEVVNKNFERN
jgi:hypothetical protein